MSETLGVVTLRQDRLIHAKLSLKRAEQHIARYPHATATPVVKDLKDALAALIAELDTS